MKFVVHMEGRNCVMVMRYPGTNMHSDERERLVGFYATRIVEARSEEEAREYGLQKLRTEVATQLRNTPDDPPSFRAIEVRQIEPPPPVHGRDELTFFTERKSVR